MKKIALCAAIIAFMAVPLLADPTPIRINAQNNPLITMTPVTDEGVRDWPHVANVGYSNITGMGVPTLKFNPGLGAGGFTGFTKFIGDDLHMTRPLITYFHWIYYDSNIQGVSTTVYHSSIIGFSAYPSLSSQNFGNLLKTASNSSALFLFSGLPGATFSNPAGGWIMSVNLGGGGWTINAGGLGAFMWGANNEVQPKHGYGMRRIPANVGFTHPWIFVGSPFTSPMTGGFGTLTHPSYPGAFNWRVGTNYPEPMSLLLLAGGLLVLRRRR
jgi:hypothetical protein